MESKNVFETKAIAAKELAEIYNRLQGKINDLSMKWAIVGKQETQAKDYKTGELLWEDEDKTIPVFRDKYDDVPKLPEDFTEEDKIRIQTIKKVMALLEKAL